MSLESRRGTRRGGRLEEREGRKGGREGEGRERNGRYREEERGVAIVRECNTLEGTSVFQKTLNIISPKGTKLLPTPALFSPILICYRSETKLKLERG